MTSRRQLMPLVCLVSYLSSYSDGRQFYNFVRYKNIDVMLKYLDPPFIFKNGVLVETELESRVANEYGGGTDLLKSLLSGITQDKPSLPIQKCFRSNKNFAFVCPWVYFLSNFNYIVQFSVEDPNFEEKVLDYQNVEDFLVDDNLTITYLTSNGELIQAHPTDLNFTENKVNLKQQNEAVTYWTSMIDMPDKRVMVTSWTATEQKNRFILVGAPKGRTREILDSVEVPSIKSRKIHSKHETDPSIL